MSHCWVQKAANMVHRQKKVCDISCEKTTLWTFAAPSIQLPFGHTAAVNLLECYMFESETLKNSSSSGADVRAPSVFKVHSSFKLPRPLFTLLMLAPVRYVNFHNLNNLQCHPQELFKLSGWTQISPVSVGKRVLHLRIWMRVHAKKIIFYPIPARTENLQEIGSISNIDNGIEIPNFHPHYVTIDHIRYNIITTKRSTRSFKICSTVCIVVHTRVTNKSPYYLETEAKIKLS